MNIENIFDTALKMYLNKGIRRVSTFDLAQQIGVSIKTLQECIGSRELLLKGVVQLFIDQTKNNIMKQVLNGNDPLEKLIKLYILILKTFNEMNPSFMYELKKYHKDQYQAIFDYSNKELYRIITGIIQEGITEELIVADAPADCYYSMHMDKIRFLIENVDRRFFANNYYLKVVLLIGEVRGMTTIKGHRILNKINISTHTNHLNQV
jgi:TetR/AcrR family transcriptional regulator, cholesterol catabolism regulator